MNHMESIIKAREIIRRKYNALRRGESETASELEKTFKPVTEPLKAVLQLHKKDPEGSMIENTEVKKEHLPEEEDVHALLKRRYGSEAGSLMNEILINPNNYDTDYGVRLTKDGAWMIGNQPVQFDQDGSLSVGDSKFPYSPGFFELVFQKEPKGYTANDVFNYTQLLERTSAHRRSYESSKPIRRTRSTKYGNIVKHLFPPLTSSENGSRPSGSGVFVPVTGFEYKYWRDPNPLCSRLALLVASRASGHNAHDREILEIEDELRQAKYIL